MELLKICILLITFSEFAASNYINNNTLHKFLLDYFDDKNITIRLIICWKNSEIEELAYKFFERKFSNQIYIHTNFTNTNFFSYMHYNIYNIIDVSCDNAQYILQNANRLDLFKAPQKWLLIQSQTKVIIDVYKMLLNTYDIQIDSEVACVENEKNKIQVWYYYKVNETVTIDRELYGIWNNTHGFQNYLTHNVTSFRRKNLHLSTIRIVSVLNDNTTLTHLKDFKYPMVDTLTKTQHVIFDPLMDYINSTMTKIWADQWGIIEDYKTERWGGMCGFIQRKEADLSGTAMFFFKPRMKIGKFLKLTNPSKIHFIFRKPPLSIEQNIYSLPFTSSVWISSLLLVLIIFVLFILFSHFENPNNEENEKVGFGNILLLMAAAICQQGCDIVPTRVPGRILTLLVFTAFMFLYVSYSANIVALLQSSSDSIKNMEDLLNSRNMRVGCHNISYNFQYFENATARVIKALYKEKIGPHGYYELQEGVAKLQKGLFAFHVEEGPAYYYILKTFEEHEKCDVATVHGVFDAQLGWIQARINSPHIELFKIGLYKISESGIENRFLKRYYRKSQCYFSIASFTSVGIVDFYPAIVLFIYGLLSTLLIFLFENIYYKYSRKKLSQAN